MCVSQSGRALAAGGGELARPITTATASAGGSGEPQSLEPPPSLPLCSRHRWPKTRARLCETSLLRALAAGSPTEFLALPPREEEAGFSCANGRATLFWDFTPHGIYEDLLHIQQSLLPSRTPTVWPSSGAEEGGTIKQAKKHRVEGKKRRKIERESEREKREMP